MTVRRETLPLLIVSFLIRDGPLLDKFNYMLTMVGLAAPALYKAVLMYVIFFDEDINQAYG